MPVRKLSAMGSSGRSTTYGVSLDHGDLELDGVLERVEGGDDVHVSISRRELGRYKLVIPCVEAEEPSAPTVD